MTLPVGGSETSNMEPPVQDPATVPEAVAFRERPTTPPAANSGEEAHGPCIVTGFYYEVNPDTTRLMAATAGDCQVMCSENVYCSTFTYWPSGACYGFGRNSKLTNGTEECLRKESLGQVIDGTCDGRLVVSGARRCGEDYYSLYPLYNVSGYQPIAPGLGEGEDRDVAAPVISEPTTSQDLDAQDEDHTPWISIIGGGLLVCACIGGAACGMGSCGSSKSKKKKRSTRSARLNQGQSEGNADYEALNQEDQEDCVEDQRPPEPPREPMVGSPLKTAPALFHQSGSSGFGQPMYQTAPPLQSAPMLMQPQAFGSMPLQPMALPSFAAAPWQAITTPLQAITTPLQTFAAAPLQAIQSWQLRPIQYITQYYTQGQAPVPGEYIVISQQEPYNDM